MTISPALALPPPVMAVPAPMLASPAVADRIRYCRDDVAVAVQRLVNEARRREGRARLHSSRRLGASARAWSVLMAQHNAVAHEFPPLDCFDGMATAGYPSNTWRGQNLAAGQTSAEEVVAAWMASPGHRDAFLSPKFNAVGIGLVVAERTAYEWFWTANLGSLPDGTARKCERKGGAG